MDLISIIVPFFNRKNNLIKCLSSIQIQTYKNLEVVIVNDGSTDNTIIESINDIFLNTDKRFRLINSNVNLGPLKARHLGYLNCKGKYIGFVDSDDFIDEDMYCILKNKIDFYDADISMCGMWNSTNENPKESIRIKYTSNKCYYNEVFIKYANWNFKTGSNCNKLYKSYLISKNKYWKTKNRLDINEDYLINFHAFKNSKSVVTCSDILYHALYNKSSYSRKISDIDLTREILFTMNEVYHHFNDKEDLIQIDKFYKILFSNSTHLKFLNLINDYKLKENIIRAINS